MTYGFRRSRYQTLESGCKITCVEINDHGFAEEEWWEKSITPWGLPPALRGTTYDCWDFVLVVPLETVRSCFCGNDGMQAWRYRGIDDFDPWAGYTIPDFCRQEGGCPEMWNGEADVKRKPELPIKNLETAGLYVVTDHRQQVTRSFSQAVSVLNQRPIS